MPGLYSFGLGLQNPFRARNQILIFRLGHYPPETATPAEEVSLEEREAACCPEDYGFEEYIKVLEDQLAAARNLKATMIEAIENKAGEWERLGDYGIKRGYVTRVEAANEIIELLESIEGK